MKRNLLLSLILLMNLMLVRVHAQDVTTMMIISDPHVMATSLFDNQADFSSDPKLVEHSAELFDIALERIVEAQPNILFIPGDMTKDGEYANHTYVAQKLNELTTNHGIQVFVVPGNHDIDNPSAYSYLGGSSAKINSVSPTEFTTIYANMGYGNAALLSSDGLSYLTWANDTLAVLGLNSTQPNTTSRASAGGLTTATLDFVDQAMDSVRARGGQVIAMMHHQLVEHFDGEAAVANTYVCNTDTNLYISRDSAHHRLMLAGVSVMLTGHFHIHSIQHVEPATRGWEDSLPTLTDISTGSLCSWPSPIRLLKLEGEELYIEDTDTIGLYQDLEKERNGNTVRGAINTLAPKLYPHISSIISKIGLTNEQAANMNLPQSAGETATMLHRYFDQSGLNLLNSLALGDEDWNDPEIIEKELKDSLNHFLCYIIPQYPNGAALKAAYGENALIVGSLIPLVEAIFPKAIEPILYNYVTTSGSLFDILSGTTDIDITNIGGMLPGEPVCDTVPDWNYETTLPLIERVDSPMAIDQYRQETPAVKYLRHEHIYIRKQEKTYIL